MRGNFDHAIANADARVLFGTKGSAPMKIGYLTRIRFFPQAKRGKKRQEKKMTREGRKLEILRIHRLKLGEEKERKVQRRIHKLTNMGVGPSISFVSDPTVPQRELPPSTEKLFIDLESLSLIHI